MERIYEREGLHVLAGDPDGITLQFILSEGITTYDGVPIGSVSVVMTDEQAMELCTSISGHVFGKHGVSLEALGELAKRSATPELREAVDSITARLN